VINTFAQIKVMTTQMFINLLACTITSNTSNIAAFGMSRRMNAQYLVKRAFQRGVGLLKELLVG
jgi:hypothetical protein